MREGVGASHRLQAQTPRWGEGVVVSDRYRKDERALAQLTPTQRAVTQESATEPAFDNQFWDHKEAGVYVDVVSGEPLFASTKKYDSGCGWPSFTVPLEPGNVVEGEDRSSLDPWGQPPRSRLRRRPGRGGRPSILHQLGRAALRALRGLGGRGVRGVPEAL